MTLVLTVLTPRFVVQVSDRQLTHRWPDGSETYPADPENKATVVADRLCFAYAGAARINGKRTDEWVAEALAPHLHVEEAAEDLMQRASAELGGAQSLTLVAGGWHEPEAGMFRPACLVISNFVRDAHQVIVRPDALVIVERNHDPHDFGRWVYEPDPGVSILLHAAGVALNDEQLTTTLRRLRRALQETADPLSLIRVLAFRIRATADHDQRVGHDLMATYLPEPVFGRAATLVLGAPLADMPTALYLPADRDNPVEYMPNFVCGGTVFERGQVVHG